MSTAKDGRDPTGIRISAISSTIFVHAALSLLLASTADTEKGRFSASEQDRTHGTVLQLRLIGSTYKLSQSTSISERSAKPVSNHELVTAVTHTRKNARIPGNRQKPSNAVTHIARPVQIAVKSVWAKIPPPENPSPISKKLIGQSNNEIIIKRYKPARNAFDDVLGTQDNPIVTRKVIRLPFGNKYTARLAY